MSTHSLAGSVGIFSLAIGLASALAGCRSLPPSKPESQFTVEEARGARVYQLKCARCHYPTTTHPLNGPGLQALTKINAIKAELIITSIKVKAA